MSLTSPNWITCQINGVADYVCKAPAGIDVLRHLAFNFRGAAERLEAEIKRREAFDQSRTDDGMFG